MPPNSDKHDRGVDGYALLPEHQQPAARPFAPKQPRQYLVGLVAAGDAVRVGVVVVNADDVGRDAFPAVVADHRAGRVERLRQVIERLRRNGARPALSGRSGTPHDSLNGTQATMHG